MLWEYKTVKFEPASFWSGGVLDEKPFTRTLNELGRQGWELVSVFDTNVHHGSTCEVVAMFKRAVAK
jgi:hypothetical protein